MRRAGWTWSRPAVLAATVITALLVVPSAHASSEAVLYRDPVFFECCRITKDIQYGEAPNTSTDAAYRAAVGDPVQLRLDVYEPARQGGPTKGLRPVYIWAHGGSFTHGDKEGSIGIAEPFVEAGWVVISIDYRLHPEVGGGGIGGYAERWAQGQLVESVAAVQQANLDAQHDAQAAVRWVRRQAAGRNPFRLDPNRIGFGGSSAGANMAVTVAYNEEDPGNSGNPGYSSRVQGAVAHSSGNVTGFDHTMGTGEPPLAYFHAADDNSVPFPPSVQTCSLALALGNVCEYHLYAQGGHATLGVNEAREFLCRWVAGTCPAYALPRPPEVVLP